MQRMRSEETVKNSPTVEKIVCNGCGRELMQKNGIFMEDFVKIEKKWGYFSQKDGDIQTLCLCESCFDGLCSKLKVPAKTRENRELLYP